jgi:hypothetical protein
LAIMNVRFSADAAMAQAGMSSMAMERANTDRMGTARGILRPA